MANRVVAFRVPRDDWESFQRLVEASERSVQDVLREFIRACLGAGSVEVKPLQKELDAPRLSEELELRDHIRYLRGYTDHGNYEAAKDCFDEVTLHLRDVKNLELLEEARSLSLVYLRWMDEGEKKRGGYEPDGD